MERLLTLMRAGGYDGEKLMLAFSSLTNYVIGSVIMDNRALGGPETEGKSLEELQAMYVEILASLPADMYPNLVRLIPEAGPAAIAEDADFEYGLQRMLDGMEADLMRSAHPWRTRFAGRAAGAGGCRQRERGVPREVRPVRGVHRRLRRLARGRAVDHSGRSRLGPRGSWGATIDEINWARHRASRCSARQRRRPHASR